jgi:anaerobic selenocysteine-containing dehydrogenase
MPPVDGTLNRRDFLFYTSAAVAGVTLGEAGRRQLARADERASAWRDRGVERWATSVCRECPAGCGVRVRLVDDVPVKLDGNPNCPIARGRLCAKGQAAIESYFDPDRLTGPARRVGRRGENTWQPISWDEAIRLFASHWPRSPRADDTQPLALGGVERGPLADAWIAMWRAAGAHVAWTPGVTAARLRPALTALTGVDADPLFDLEHATYVLSFSAPIVEDWLSPLWAQRSYGRFRRGAAHGRGRLVQVDVRRSLTARKADEWIALPIEQQVVLAYGLASVILRERRADAAFLEEFGGTLPAFEARLVARFSPDDVAALTGVPVVTVLRLARELAGSPRPLVAVAADADRALVDAVFALNAIVGAFDRAGGIMASPATPLDDLEDATKALWEVARGARHPAGLALRDAAPLRAVKAPAFAAGATDAVPFIVSFSPYLDDAAGLADLLLPTHTALESWHIATPASAVPSELVAAAAPAVRARLNTRDLASVLERIGGEIAGNVAAVSPWTPSEQIVREALTRVAALHRGAPYSSAYETEWLRQLEQGGWWVPAVDAGHAIATVLEAGGWGDPGFQPGSIRESLRARRGLTFAPPVDVPMPPAVVNTAEMARSNGDRGRLRLVAFTPSAVNLAGNPNQPVLFELLGQPDGAPWSVWAELNRDVARERGIQEGDRVRIVSDAGAIEARVQLVDGMTPGAIAVSFVPGVAPSGRWAAFVRQDLRRLCGPAGFESACDVTVVRV